VTHHIELGSKEATQTFEQWHKIDKMVTFHQFSDFDAEC
jgi:hypothetical protein